MFLKTLIVTIVILFSSISVADRNETAQEIERIKNSIKFILTEGIPKHKIKPWKYHPILKNENQLYELSTAIYDASAKKDVPSSLLIAIAYREGTFKNNSVGKLGEISTFQMIPRTAKTACKIDEYCGQKDLFGDALKAAILLRHWYESCDNDWKGALTIYATGKPICKSKNKHVRWISNDRVGIAKFLIDKFWRDIDHPQI